jgi:hypothetical protein
LGSWKEFYKTESSNRREFENLVQRLESFAKSHRGAAIEVFMFTDNYVTEYAYFKGTSSSPILFGLVLRLHKLELHSGWKNHVIDIAGTRMISQGIDGLCRGDILTGVMGFADMFTFIPLALTAVERHPDLMDWVDSWWGTGNNSWLIPQWMVCRFRPDWNIRVVPPTCCGRCSLGATVQMPSETTWRSC